MTEPRDAVPPREESAVPAPPGAGGGKPAPAAEPAGETPSGEEATAPAGEAPAAGEEAGAPGGEAPASGEAPSAAGAETPGTEAEPREAARDLPAAPVTARARHGWRDALAEPPEAVVEVPRSRLAAQSRRDFLLFGAGVLAVGALAWWLLPDAAKARLLPGPWRDRLDTLAARVGLSRDARERALDGALTFDDDVAEALYSEGRRVRTYARSRTTPLRNNYAGRTPDPGYLASWSLELSGLASGRRERLGIRELLARFARHEQVTRLVCVEGWSAVAWWGGIRFADLVAAFPPAPGARWAELRSDVNLDGAGNPDPYYVSIDLATARHPQTLLATHLSGNPLTVDHGAPLRLVAPMKLGLKNIKAITRIAYGAEEPPDYWNERGYSKYDGI